MTLRLREIALSLGEDESLLPTRIAATLNCPVTDIDTWTIVRGH